MTNGALDTRFSNFLTVKSMPIVMQIALIFTQKNVPAHRPFKSSLSDRPH